MAFFFMSSMSMSQYSFLTFTELQTKKCIFARGEVEKPVFIAQHLFEEDFKYLVKKWTILFAQLVSLFKFVFSTVHTCHIKVNKVSCKYTTIRFKKHSQSRLTKSKG